MHWALKHSELVDDKHVIVKCSTGRYECNKCESDYVNKKNLVNHRAVQHALTSSDYISSSISRKCPVSGMMIHIDDLNFPKHIQQCKIDKENDLQVHNSLVKSREERFKTLKNMPAFSAFIFDELNKIEPVEKDLPCFHYLMLILALRPGLDLLKGAGFFNILKRNIRIEDRDKLLLNYQCKGNQTITKELRIESFLVDIINNKLQSMSHKDYFFCNGMKDRSALPNIYCKNFHPQILPQLCRTYRATLELQNAFHILENYTKNDANKQEVLKKKLLLNLNESGDLLLQTHFITQAFGNISDLLSHKMSVQEARSSRSCKLFNRSDLDYVDDRLVYNFFKNYLNERAAKLFYFRLYKTLICTYDTTQKSKQFESWSEQHYWAFDLPDHLHDQVIQPYFYENNWINEFFLLN